jgi:hypothetical protein
MKCTELAAAIACGLTLAGGLARAADTTYDLKETVILDGFVKSVDWAGKQFILVFHSNDGYDGADWTVVGPATADLLRMGWNKDMLKAGDRLDTVVHPAADGSTRGSLMRFYLKDGRTMEIGVYGTLNPIPREHLKRRFENAADDPVRNLYGNTQVFYAEDAKGPPEANYNGRVWFNADHSLVMFSNDLKPDGKTWSNHAMKGTWWLEKQQGKWVRCNWFEPSALPFCHSPAEAPKVNEPWSVVFRGERADWIEHRVIEVGQH